MTDGTGVPTKAIKLAEVVSMAPAILSINSSSRPKMASKSRNPAEYIALFLVNQRGSSNPQVLPAHPPASKITMIPPSSYSTLTAPEISGANGDK